MSGEHEGPDAARRRLIGGVGAGLVAAPAFTLAQGAAATPPAAAEAATRAARQLRDPRHAYPRPPFPRQQQAPPGLAGQMDPKPDHGEQSYVGSGRLAGRRALITGGDSGIGRAVAIAFAREGADVAINYLPVEEPDAREVVELIRKVGRRAVAIPGDIREEAFCGRLVTQAVQQLGGLDILVNNAGHQQARQSIEDISTEDFDTTFKTNVYALFWITKAALPHLPAGSSIINTTSIQAYQPSKQLFDYAATKAAIASFSKSLAQQLAPKGIRVNGVAPGPYWTPLQPSGGTLPDMLPEFGAKSPMQRPGQPAEIAPTYVLLASAESSFTTGDILGATGGEIMA